MPTQSERARLVSFSVDSGPVDEAIVIKKLNRRVLPVCWLILILANLDRGNLGFAANQLCQDLDLSHSQYGRGAGIFFVGFLFTRPTSNIALKHFGAPFWLMAIMFSWGACAAAMACMTNVVHFYILRFLLGVAEGGAFPGVWYFITGFYADDQLSVPYTITAIAFPVAMALSGPITAFFMSWDGFLGQSGWRYLFFFEGIVPVLLAPVLYFIIPKDAMDADFLTMDERRYVQQRIEEGHDNSEKNFYNELKIVLRSRPFWIVSLGQMLRLALFGVIMYWTTLMIEESVTTEEERDLKTCASSRSIGFGAIGLTALVFTCAACSTVVLGVSAANLKNRPPLAALIYTLGGFALCSWPLAEHLRRHLGLLSLTVSASALNTPLPLVVGLVVSFFDQQTKSTALSVFAFADTIGMLFGPVITGAIVDHYNNYDVASFVVGAVGIVGGMLLLPVRDPLMSKFPAETIERGMETGNESS